MISVHLIEQGTSPVLVYGLGFMLVTLLLASFSDLRRMTIKAEYMTMWIGLTVLMLLYDYFSGSQYILIKWGMIILLGILSYEKSGKIFKLAKSDVVAISAVCSVISFIYIIPFYLILLVVNSLGSWPLGIFGKKNSYPFMPVIFLSVLVLVFILGIVNWQSLLEMFGNWEQSIPYFS